MPVQTEADPSEHADCPTDSLSASGIVSPNELKKITRIMRTSSVGPTTVYYAGVTAPAIAAGMATVVAAALERAGWVEYWVLLISAIIAAMAGISWYLIFMRLSYRHAVGRSTETGIETRFEADEAGIFWSRGEVKTRIGWSGIPGIHLHGSFIQIEVTDTGDVILPKSWFHNKRSEMKSFGQSLITLWQEHHGEGAV